MAVAISATILSGAAPAPIQVVVTGMTDGDAYTIRGTYGDHSWPIPGGVGTSDGTQLVLIDNRAPFNGDVVYTVTIDGVVTSASPVELTLDVYAILQSVDGSLMATVEIGDSTDQRDYTQNATLFVVDGRPDPVARLSIASTATMTWLVEADGADATMLKHMLAAGGPLVRRNTVDLRDVPPVELVVVTSRSDRLIGAVGTLRAFTLGVQAIGDPEPGTALSAFDWDDFDAAWSGQDWDDFDAAWSGQDWDDFDRFDYGA